MIEFKNNQHILRFGKGDIRISSGTTEYVKEGICGLVTFENQEPHPIGKNREDGTRIIDLDNAEALPVYMTFTRVESIDALIGELQNAKEEMLKHQPTIFNQQV